MTKVDKKNIQFTSVSLDKLAQLAQPPIDATLRDTKILQKKARAKYITNALTYRLTRIQGSPLHKSYLNTYYCASVIEQKGQILKSSYCNNRWCVVCNRIRTAKLINGYFEQLQALQTPFFVTLTIPNVQGEILRETIEKMQYTMYTIIHRWQSHHKDKVNGVRKIECTYNPITNTFHPHFHLIVDTKNHAEYIVNQWLTSFENAEKIAQDVRPCSSQQSILELFKYFTKILTNKHDFYAPQMDTIFKAMRRKRVYQPFGNIHPIVEDIEDIQKEEYANLVNEDRLWEWCENDWVDTENGEVLSGYVPSEQAKTLIDNILHK